MAIPIRSVGRIRKVKSGDSQKILERLQNFLEQNGETRGLVQILCGFWEDQRTAISYPELRQVIEDGMVSTEMLRLWSQDYSKLVARSFYDVWMKAALAGAAGQPLLGDRNFSFRLQAPGVINWINRHGAEFVTSCIDEQRKAIAALVTKKMTDSHTVDELARLIRPCIGLTEAQAKANTRYYDSIVENLKKEHPRMKKESVRKKAQDAALKYAERQHQYRAMTIAQTESAFAYNWGADEAIRQAQAAGYMGKTKKKWCTSGDDSVCEQCNSLDGMEIEMDSEFQIKGRLLFTGQHLLPPAHPRCGCAVEYIEIEKQPYDVENISTPKTNSDRDMQNLNHINGLSSEEIDREEIFEHEKPKYLGSLDKASDTVVKSILQSYELEIVAYDKESAIVVTKEGLIFQCFGTKERVFPDIDLGEELVGASVTHNHPVGSVNEYSFSKADIELFMQYQLKILRGIDEKYVYELSRLTTEVDRHVTLEELMFSDGDFSRHEDVITFAETWGIGYRRCKR